MAKHRESINGIKKTDLKKAIAGCCFVLAALLIIYVLIGEWEHSPVSSEDGGEETAGSSDRGGDSVTVDGIEYTRVKNLETYLFMGIDVEGPAVSNGSYIGGGQADVQMLIVVNHEDETWQLLQLNRDSIAEVPVLGVTGNIIGYEKQQIALAHSYGSGLKDSCENNVMAVSMLLNDQKIDGYFAMNMDGIAIVNDAVGGVTVQVTSDFSAVDETLVQGESVTLEGEHALTFVRTRKEVDDQSNLARMGRQRTYLAALQKQLAELDIADALKVYEEVSDYVVTDMGSGSMTDLLKDINRYSEKELLTIDGKAEVTDDYIAYYLDEESLQKVILELFYKVSD